LAGETSLSPFQLSRLFGRITGKTIPGMLREKRMEVSAELLKQSDARIGEVAVKVGYSSLSAFNRAFTREIGIAPLKYRKNFRRDAGEVENVLTVQPRSSTGRKL
jgi:AraC-like DNA-binding protein